MACGLSCLSLQGLPNTRQASEMLNTNSGSGATTHPHPLEASKEGARRHNVQGEPRACRRRRLPRCATSSSTCSDAPLERPPYRVAVRAVPGAHELVASDAPGAGPGEVGLQGRLVQTASVLPPPPSIFAPAPTTASPCQGAATCSTPPARRRGGSRRPRRRGGGRRQRRGARRPTAGGGLLGCLGTAAAHVHPHRRRCHRHNLPGLPPQG